MNKLPGRLMMAMALGHALIGFVLFSPSLAAIFHDGFFNTIEPPLYVSEPHFDRIATFWFLLFSPMLFLLGQITNRAIERRDTRTLRIIGWYLVGMGVVGTAVLTVSGNAAVAVLGAYVLRRAQQGDAHAARAQDTTEPA